MGEHIKRQGGDLACITSVRMIIVLSLDSAEWSPGRERAKFQYIQHGPEGKAENHG